MANSSLNLNSDVTPLTHSKAVKGDDREAWILDHDTEMRKLISGSHTMHPIHETAIPVASSQTHPTERVKEQAIRLLQYARAFPDNSVVFHKSKSNPMHSIYFAPSHDLWLVV